MQQFGGKNKIQDYSLVSWGLMGGVWSNKRHTLSTSQEIIIIVQTQSHHLQVYQINKVS